MLQGDNLKFCLCSLQLGNCPGNFQLHLWRAKCDDITGRRIHRQTNLLSSKQRLQNVINRFHITALHIVRLQNRFLGRQQVFLWLIE